MQEEINLNAPAHLEGAGPEVLMEEEHDRSLKVEEDGTVGKTVSVEGDMGPRVGLRELGSAALPRNRTPDHSPCRHLRHPPP